MSDLDTEFTVTVTERDLPQNHPAEIVTFRSDAPEYQLVVGERVLTGIRRQAGNSPISEIGGVLVGRHYDTGGHYLVNVADYIPVPSKDSGVAHFAFDESSIKAILAGLEQRPDHYVVGWYHSHVAGEPFMSTMDFELHRTHFPLPWYVSCVVSLGAWGRSAGFWRMTNDELRNVADYAVSVNDYSPRSQQRHLEACGFDEQATIEPNLIALVRALGVEDNSALATVIEDTAADWQRSGRLSDVRFLIIAAKAAVGNPAAVADLDRLSLRLDRLRLLSDILESVELPLMYDRIALRDKECYSYSRDRLDMYRFELDQGTRLPVWVESEPTDMSHAPDRHPWVVTRGRVIRLDRVDPVRWRDGDRTFDVASTKLPDLPDEPEQILVSDAHVWLRTDSTWHRFTWRVDGAKVVLAAEASGQLPGDGCVLVDGNGFESSAEPPVLLGSDDGMLRLWRMADDGEDPSWQPAVEAALPAPWHELMVVRACRSGQGWYVLLAEDEEEKHLCLFDTHTLALVYHAFRTADDEPVTDLSSDGAGRVYVDVGGVLYRV